MKNGSAILDSTCIFVMMIVLHANNYIIKSHSVSVLLFVFTSFRVESITKCIHARDAV